MKNKILLFLSALLLFGCGGNKKNPVGNDLQTIRKEGKTTTEMGPQKPKVITNTEILIKEKEVIREESTIDDKFIVISMDEELLSFSEGEASTYKIRARALVKGLKIELIASDLPPGATLSPSKTEKDLYLLSWTPALYSIPAQSARKTFKSKLTARVVSTENTSEAQKYSNLIRESNVFLVLYRNQEAPHDLKAQGLPSEVIEGSEPSLFKMIVKVPGMDNKGPSEPRIVASYDGLKNTAGNNFLEMDGSRYLILKDVQYINDFQWEFSFYFDTKRIPVQPQLSKDGSVITNSDVLNTRMSFKVYNQNGQSTPESVYQVKIRFNKNIVSPKFDISGLVKESLEVSRGETINLKFIVSSPDIKAEVQVESPESNLPGSPKLACMNSAQGSHKQNCLLSWTVPCDSTKETLTGAISLNAKDQLSNSSEYEIKTKLAAKEKSLCNKARK